MGSRPTIRLCSHDARRQRGSSKLAVVVALGPPVLFGAAVYAAPERGETGSWARRTLLLFVLPVAVVARFRASLGFGFGSCQLDAGHLVHRFQNSNYIKRRCRVYRTKYGRQDVG